VKAAEGGKEVCQVLEFYCVERWRRMGGETRVKGRSHHAWGFDTSVVEL
jgi:hypothetical protein